MGSSIPLLHTVPRVYPLLGMLGGYLLVMLTNPVRVALRDGLRCVLRFKRLWLVFALLALAYSTFQFVVFTPLQSDRRPAPRAVRFLGDVALAALFPSLARKSAPHRRIGRRNFRCRCDHLSALGSRGVPPDSQLARPAPQPGARVAQAIRPRRLADLSRRLAQRARLAAQAADLLATARIGRISFHRRIFCRPQPRSIRWRSFLNISARFTSRSI